jgi:hypothetical protein
VGISVSRRFDGWMGPVGAGSCPAPLPPPDGKQTNQYGVDALNVDWNDQAAKKAASYLEYSSFSRSGLIEQLAFEGFSREQAEHGVSTTGL